MASSMFFPTEFPYSDGQKAGVMIMALSGLSSLMAIICLFIFNRPKRRTFRNTHMFGYFMSLLFANILQSIAAVMDFQWVAKGSVRSGALCSTQAGIELAGNLGTSIFSVMIALHLFHILFLRFRATNPVFVGALVCAWTFVLFDILIGRFAIQTPKKGPYFGIAGSGCSITLNYGVERMVSEYLFSFLSIGMGFILCSLVFLRVRGNLVRNKYHEWNFVKQNEDGKFTITQDAGDNSMNRLAQKLVWLPLSYALILLPISVVRIAEFSGVAIPFWATASTTAICNLTGLVNVLLVLYIENRVPDTNDTLPTFSEKPWHSRSPSAASGDILSLSIHVNRSVEKFDDETSERVVVKLPTKPEQTYIAPDAWNTTAAKGKTYL
ncbi:hypothetical protein GALMADRAFT_448937 [Galerina marginata CBS 339.88]|uniref:Glucose receptor Git3 N-terminal domain-containing protein n=1 Tax=Galerina marginata (strain CBS 339.88) TaxID=685588 RepID=A0A067T2I3_GALM3|nr:hypothetical protein GALMADRAFT_448937 [Galerina marginata CBS 339.88]